MNIILIAVALVSLALAAIMSFVAWRLARDTRRRSEARIAVLARDIHDSPEPLRPFAEPRVDLSSAEGRGAEAPTNRGGDGVAAATREYARRAAEHDLPQRGPAAAFATSGSDLFAAGRPASSGSRLAAVMALGIFVVGSAAALAVVLSSGSRGVTNPASSANLANPLNPSNPLNPTSVPLELIALGHERNADRLTVRGTVRNPPAGSDISRLTAVVFAFKHDGGFLISARAPVDTAALAPGAESPFVVVVPGAADVGRYRVSFRTDAAVVPHVDRRARGAMAQLK